MFESLDRRLLLASVAINNGILRIEGTSGNDSVALARFNVSQAQVIDGAAVALTFDLADVRAISFAGGDGDDLIILGRISRRAFLSGGAGNDSLSASQGTQSDTLLGADGNDYLFGGPGDDTLVGGVGGDTMLGDAGNDVITILSDNTGDDLVSGGAGFDEVTAADYPDDVVLEVGNSSPFNNLVDDAVLGDVERVTGSAFDDSITVVSGRSVYIDAGAGNDTVATGRGNDTIIGGAGTDLLSSAGGNDFFDTLDGQVDTLTGGSGVDTANADPFEVLNSVTNTAT